MCWHKEAVTQVKVSIKALLWTWNTKNVFSCSDYQHKRAAIICGALKELIYDMCECQVFKYTRWWTHKIILQYSNTWIHSWQTLWLMIETHVFWVLLLQFCNKTLILIGEWQCEVESKYLISCIQRLLMCFVVSDRLMEPELNPCSDFCPYNVTLWVLNQQ